MKKIFLVMYSFIIISSLVLSVSAHPGGTDSDGGHTDSSTGEYHYHHNYPAHDHYDMDGDGDIDCPYNFEYRKDDTTDNNSQSNTNTNPMDNTSNEDQSTNPPEYPIPQTESKSTSNYTYSYIVFGFVLVVLVFAIWLVKHEFKGNTQYDDEAASLGEKILSSLSVIIIFLFLFAIMIPNKYPITLQEISFWEMIMTIVKACFLGGFVWGLSILAAIPINKFLSKLLRQKVATPPAFIWALAMLLSYIFSVSAFILQ